MWVQRLELMVVVDWLSILLIININIIIYNMLFVLSPIYLNVVIMKIL